MTARADWRRRPPVGRRPASSTTRSLASCAKLKTLALSSRHTTTRVERKADDQTQTTVWNGWQSIEEYAGNALDEQKVYGLGLDEVVERAKADGAGGFDRYGLLYSSTGEPAVQIAADGRPVERYEHSTLGERKVLVDVERPTVGQVSATPSSIRIELSEQVRAPGETTGASGSLRAQGPDIALTDAATGASIDVIAKLAPAPGPGLERRRLEIDVPSPPPAGTQVKLSLAPQALEDFFANRPDGMSEWTFAWPASGLSIVEDTAPPELVRALLRDGKIEATFSKAVTPEGLGDAVSVDGASVAWTVSGNGLVATTSAALSGGAHHVEFGTAPIDLAGKGLATPIAVDLTVPSALLRAQAGNVLLVFEPRNPRELDQSPTGQQASFQGHPVDPETGFVYLRNRYFDPELGRFITADPMGYPDGPSDYAFGAGDVVNGRDPMGLERPLPRSIQPIRPDESLSEQMMEDQAWKAFWRYQDRLERIENAIARGLQSVPNTATEEEWRDAVQSELAREIGPTYAEAEMWNRFGPAGPCETNQSRIFRNVGNTAGTIAPHLWFAFQVEMAVLPFADAGAVGVEASYLEGLRAPRVPLPEPQIPRQWGSGFSGPEELTQNLPRRIATVDPSTVRFSQDSIGRTFGEGGTLREAIEGLRDGSISPEAFPPIRVFERNGLRFTLDNRRLFVFQQAGVPIPSVQATVEEIAADAWKFTTRNEGISIRVRGGL